MELNMDHLDINNNTTLWPPDKDGEIAIDMWTEESGNNIVYVSLEVLKTWIASIEKPSNTAMQIDKKPCMHCKNEQEEYKAHDFCGFCGRAFDY